MHSLRHRLVRAQASEVYVVIYVENYPQKRCFRLPDYHPLWGWGC